MGKRRVTMEHIDSERERERWSLCFSHAYDNGRRLLRRLVSHGMRVKEKKKREVEGEGGRGVFVKQSSGPSTD